MAEIAREGKANATVRYEHGEEREVSSERTCTVRIVQGQRVIDRQTQFYVMDALPMV